MFLLQGFFMLHTTFFVSRGCLGCCSKLPLITAADKPPKGLHIQGRSLNNLSDNFWSSSVCKKENSGLFFQRSVLLFSMSNTPLDPGSSSSNGPSGGTSDPTEFINHGLLLWNQMREQWLAIDNPKIQKRVGKRTTSDLSNATYESLLGSNKLLPHAISLPEMVDFLVDVWEQGGLYD